MRHYTAFSQLMKRTLLIVFALLVALGSIEAQRVIRVLAIGNSFSEDAIENNLYDLAKAQGDIIVVGNLYIGGASLELHSHNAALNLPAYRYRKTDADGQRHQADTMALARALNDEPWDYVSLQQASHYSGQYATYKPYLTDLVALVKKHCPRARLLWHQTWAYAANSTHDGFANYGRDQQRMYRSIIAASRQAMRDGKFKRVVPSGTAIQNMRTSFIGDKLTRDGYHLNLIYGRYVAACTWLEVLTGRTAVGNSYAPQGMTPQLIRVSQTAAHAAVKHPWRVTDMSGYKE